MHLNKLITVWRALPKEQMKALKDYIHSPYFKVPPHAVALFDYLAPLYPEFYHTRLAPKAIGRGAANISTYAKQARAGNTLLLVIEDFISMQHWQKTKTTHPLSRLSGLKELQLASVYKKELKQYMQQLDSNPEQDCDVFLERHLLTELSFNGFAARLDRTQQNNLLPVIQTLDEFHALKKLRYLCEQLNRQRALGLMHKPESVTPLLQTLLPYTTEQYPYLYLFVNVYRMLEETSYEESSVYYHVIKQYIQRRPRGAQRQSIREAADYALAYCLRWYNTGHAEAGREYIWWIEWKHKNARLLQNGLLVPVTFRNMISAAVISTLPTGHIKKLIDTYAPLLPREHHPAYSAFAQGLYHYARQEHARALQFLITAQVKDDAVFSSTIRRWQWICLYESGAESIDSLYAQLKSFTSYLQRHQSRLHHVSDSFKKFVWYAYRLLEANGEMSDKLLQQMDNEEYFAGINWFKQQLAIKASVQKKGALQKQFA